MDLGVEIREKTRTMVVELSKKVKKIGEDDPRRIAHSFKVGLALTLVSVFYYVTPLFDGFGVSSMWAVLTVVVIMEYTVGTCISCFVSLIPCTWEGRSCTEAVPCALLRWNSKQRPQPSCRNTCGWFTGSCSSSDRGPLRRERRTHPSRALRLHTRYASPLLPVECWYHVFVPRSALMVRCVCYMALLAAAAATFSRFIPEIKARYDYGVTIFILTFSLVAVSSYRVDELIQLALQRVSTIVVGVATCLCTSIFVFPVWAGEDLHKLVAADLEKLANFLEGI